MIEDVFNADSIHKFKKLYDIENVQGMGPHEFKTTSPYSTNR